MPTDNTGYLVETIKTALMSNPNMNILVSRAMAKFVQNLYDLDVSNTKVIEAQRAVIANQKDLIENLKKYNNDQANIKWTNITV
jgi:DNA-binding transcriptional regulator WhiA